MAYIFKPRREQVDRIAAVTEDLRELGSDITIASFYRFAADRALDLYSEDFERFLSEYGAHVARDRATGG